MTADSNPARPLCALPTPQRMSVVGSRDRASASAGSTACATLVFDDPLAGYIPPEPGQQSGQGLWITRQLVSRLEFLFTPDGHTTRLWL